MRMAEGKVPYVQLNFLCALFMIVTTGAPGLKDPELWSPEFHNFLSQCLLVDAAKRPSAASLLEHPFIKKAGLTSDLIGLIIAAQNYSSSSMGGRGGGTASLDSLMPTTRVMGEKLSEEKAVQLAIKNQHSDGHWELTQKNISLLGLDCNVLDMEEEVLIRSGCQSLGPIAYENARAMVATALVVVYLQQQMQNGLECGGIAKATAHGSDWLKTMDQTFPMLPYRLDLGVNWTHFADWFLKEKMCTISIKQ